MANLDKYKEVYTDNFKFYDENKIMFLRYSQLIIEIIRENNYRSLLSLGIGQQVVIKKILSEISDLLEKYLIIEGSHQIVNKFKKEIRLPPYVKIVYSLFENFETSEKYDVIEMGFILEHVDDPFYILEKYKKFLNPKGSIIITVPNAKSLHRLIGYKSGMLSDLYKLSEHDLKAGHKRYFDMDSLMKLVSESGLKVEKKKGLFLKPFSTNQLKSLNLPSEIVNALCLIAEDYPEISNEIFIQASLFS